MISVGGDNKFGHPNEEVLERFEIIGTRVFRTDESGEVVILVDKKGKIVRIEKHIS